MVSCITDSGFKNSLGYYDSKSKELFLKHPFSKKKEVEDVYEWAECAQTHGLEKIIIGIGPIEGFMAETAIDDIYLSSRAVMRQALEHTKAFDANVLIEILLRVEKCKELKALSLRAFSFEGQTIMFDMLMKTIRIHKNIEYLDLTGCFFTEEQLVEMAEFIGASRIAQVNWPEPVMSDETIENVKSSLLKNDILVVLNHVPHTLQEVAIKNRRELLCNAKYQLSMSDVEVNRIKNNKEAVRLAINYEQTALIELQKTIESILI